MIEMIEIPTRGKVGLPHYLKKIVGPTWGNASTTRTTIVPVSDTFESPLSDRDESSNTYIRKLDAVIN